MTTGPIGLFFADPFRQKGRWLKGNTHTHTVHSDGQLTPEEVRREYARRGYDFVFLTDHWKRTVPSPSPAKPLLIPAEELDFTLRGNVFHVVCLGLRSELRLRSFRSLSDVARLAARNGAFVIMAHPYWSGSRSETYLGTDFPAVEVYNTVCDNGCAKGYSNMYWDDFLAAGKPVLGIAADDAHSAAAVAGGWIMVKASVCTEKAILGALRQGHFYATQGPVIKDIRITGRRVTVACSPVRRINFVGNRWLGGVVRAGKQDMTGAEWEIPLDNTYVRIECVDRDGKTAWSNPIRRVVDERRLEAEKRRTLQSAVAPRVRPADGNPDSIPWSSAAVLSNWRTLFGGDAGTRKVEGRLVHDGRYLYIQLEERLDPRRLVMKHNTVWNEDEWELFFSDRPGKPCRHMGVNAAGVQVALIHGKAQEPWENRASVVSNTRLPDRWRVRVALPLDRLVRGGVRPGGTIYLNVVRSTETSRALCWIPPFRSYYHEPSRLGAVRLA